MAGLTSPLASRAVRAWHPTQATEMDDFSCEWPEALKGTPYPSLGAASLLMKAASKLDALLLLPVQLPGGFTAACI